MPLLQNHRRLVFGKGMTPAQPGSTDRMVLAVGPAEIRSLLGRYSRLRGQSWRARNHERIDQEANHVQVW